MKKFTQFLFLLLCLCGSKAFSQVKIGNNPTSVNPNSLLELESSSKGLLLPRLTNDQIKAMTGVPTGMLLFSITDSALYLRKDTGWAVLGFKTNPVSSPWAKTSNGDIYNTNRGKVGIGTSTPYSLLSNSSADGILDASGYGGNDGSFYWKGQDFGYAGMVVNPGNSYQSNGLLVKTTATNATTLDVSQTLPGNNTKPLFRVNGDGTVGIGTTTPQAKLDVNGDMKVSGNVEIGGNVKFNGGVPVAIIDSVVNGTVYAGEFREFTVGCPTGYKLISGGGGHRDFNFYQKELTVNFSGPDPANTDRWRVLMTNTSTNHYLQVQVYAKCAGVK